MALPDSARAPRLTSPATTPGFESYLLTQTHPNPAENLALDEALFLAQERGELPGPVLRLWESARPFAVIGLSGRVANEVDEAACTARSLPVLRRISGGGTVVQGPGCLSYALVAPLDARPEFEKVSASYTWILGRIAEQFPALEVQLSGLSDLNCRGRKVSGNAQKRGRRALLHHGTLLYAFNAELLEAVLPHPPREPGYREGRPHREFVSNLPISHEELASGLVRAFSASRELAHDLIPDLRPCALERYERDSWNCRL